MTPDSSVLIAAFGTWHESHESARVAVRGLHDLIAHAELESYSVLTRLPESTRAPASVVAEFLGQFDGRRLSLGSPGRRGLVSQLLEHGVSGGAAYDALIALTALEHERTLLTLDRRAVTVYQRVGADYELIG